MRYYEVIGKSGTNSNWSSSISTCPSDYHICLEEEISRKQQQPNEDGGDYVIAL